MRECQATLISFSADADFVFKKNNVPNNVGNCQSWCVTYLRLSWRHPVQAAEGALQELAVANEDKYP